MLRRATRMCQPCGFAGSQNLSYKTQNPPGESLCRFESGLRHHKEIKGLGSKGLPLFYGGFWVGVHIVHVPAHQGL